MQSNHLFDGANIYMYNETAKKTGKIFAKNANFFQNVPKNPEIVKWGWHKTRKMAKFLPKFAHPDAKFGCGKGGREHPFDTTDRVCV